MLKGQRIGLRAMRSEDAWLLYRWYNDRRVTADLGSRKLNLSLPLEEVRWRVEKALDQDNERHYIIAIEGSKDIGLVSLRGIDQRSATGELRIIIGEPSLWGKGYGQEAVAMMRDHGFEVLNLHRIYLRVPEYNHRAIRCFEACGFEKEGVMRDDHYHMGTYMSSLLMSALRKEGKT